MAQKDSTSATERDPLLPSSGLEPSSQQEPDDTPEAQTSTESSLNNPFTTSSTVTSTRRQAPQGRISYLDSLRVFLTILVIFHHAALAFVKIGGWYYDDPSCSPDGWNNSDTPSDSDSRHGSNGTENMEPRPLLAVFILLNQSFFMASFFVMSGYFSTLSLRKRAEKAAVARRGESAVGGFVKDRMVRLGVPMVNTNSVSFSESDINFVLNRWP
jgi:hypothetical protein